MPETAAGISSPGDIEYTVEHIQEGQFGQGPESRHEKVFRLLRLTAANHPFVDGNKRTALMLTRIFYALNGLRFDYNREIKELLKALATDEGSVDADDGIEYLRTHTEPLAPEYEATINLWQTRIEGTDQLPTEHDTANHQSNEPNDYDDDPHSVRNSLGVHSVFATTCLAPLRTDLTKDSSEYVGTVPAGSGTDPRAAAGLDPKVVYKASHESGRWLT